MLRRRLMFIKQEEPAPPVDDWDIKWDYEMGLPENSYFNKITSGTNFKQEMQSNGLYLMANAANTYIGYTPKGYTTNDNTIIEIKFVIKTMANTSNGFRVRLSDGSKGAQVYFNKYWNSSNLKYGLKNTISVSEIPIIIDEEYTLRLEWLKSENLYKITLNDEIIENDISNSSTQYCTNNAIFMQEFGSVLLKSIKYKFL